MLQGLSLHSLITAEGKLLLSLDPQALGEPGPDEVIIRVEAAPLNPTDHYQMTGPADFTTMAATEVNGPRALTMDVPAGAMPFVGAGAA